jgi:hypothetical protein
VAGTAGNVLPQPQGLSDFITSSGVNKNSCETDKTYWNKHIDECKKKGWYYNKSNRETSGVNKNSCQTNKNYWDKNKDACKKKGWYYNKGNRSADKNDEQCDKWKKNNPEKYDKNCKHALDDFFANYEDADLIFDILTAGLYDEDEDIPDGDSKEDLDEAHDE